MEKLEKTKSIESENNIKKSAEESKEIVRINCFREKVNTTANDVLIEPEYIEFIEVKIPKEVFNRYEIFLNFLKEQIDEEEIKKNLSILDKEIIWEDDLFLRNCIKLPENIKFPGSIKGQLNLLSITELPNDIKFPDSIDGHLVFSSLLKLPKNFIFPSFNGDLCLHSLKELPNGIKFPHSINGDLWLHSVAKLTEDILFPNTIGGSLYLQSIEELPQRFKFPTYIGGALGLGSLTEIPEDIKFPDFIGGSIFLNSLTILPANFKIQNSINQDLYLNSLTILPDNFQLPEYSENPFGCSINLNSIKKLPSNIKIKLDLNLSENNNLDSLHRDIECKTLKLTGCFQLYTIKNYQIIKYLSDNNKIEEVIGFPMEEIERNIEIIDEIISDKKSSKDKNYHILKENTTQKILIYGEDIIKEVYNKLNEYLISLKEESIQYKNEISAIVDLKDYQNMAYRLNQIHKEIKEKPLAVRDRLVAIFSNDLWVMVIERLKKESSRIVNFLEKS